MEDSCATNKTIFGQIELQKWTFFLVVDSLEEFDGLLSTISLFKFYNRRTFFCNWGSNQEKLLKLLHPWANSTFLMNEKANLL